MERLGAGNGEKWNGWRKDDGNIEKHGSVFRSDRE